MSQPGTDSEADHLQETGMASPASCLPLVEKNIGVESPKFFSFFIIDLKLDAPRSLAANPGSLVKWLYPAHLLNMDNNEGSTARQEAFENDKNIAMSTRAAEGGIMDAAASPTTTSGPDSDIASVEELNPGSIDDEDDEDDDGQGNEGELSAGGLRPRRGWTCLGRFFSHNIRLMISWK